MTLEQELLELANGEELALFYFPGEEMRWHLDVGNKSPCVLLGEVPGELQVSGKSIPDVIMAMKAKQRNTN